MQSPSFVRPQIEHGAFLEDFVCGLSLTGISSSVVHRPIQRGSKVHQLWRWLSWRISDDCDQQFALPGRHSARRDFDDQIQRELRFERRRMISSEIPKEALRSASFFCLEIKDMAAFFGSVSVGKPCCGSLSRRLF